VLFRGLMDGYLLADTPDAPRPSKGIPFFSPLSRPNFDGYPLQCDC